MSKGRGEPTCWYCGADKTPRPRDGFMECRECKKAYLRLVQSAGLTRSQAKVVNETLMTLGQGIDPEAYDPDSTPGGNDSKWVSRCVDILSRWLWRVSA